MTGILVIALILTLLTRLAYLFTFQFKKVERDATCHLMLVKTIRNNTNRILPKYTQFVMDTNTYPQGFHKGAALTGIPLNILERYGGLVPIVSDVLLLALTIVVCQQNGLREPLWLLLYPGLRLLWGYEERAFHFNPRAWGNLLGNLYLVSAFMFIQTGNWIWLVSGLVGFLGFSCSSKFAWQAVVFITGLLSLSLLRWEYLAVFLGTLTLSALLCKGYNIKVLKGLIGHSYVYKVHDLATNWGIRNYYAHWVEVFHRIKLRKLIFLLFHLNPLAKMVTQFPIIIPFLVIWAQSGFHWTPWLAYAMTGIILVPVIATEALKFLGEPERYLEFSIIPIFACLVRYPVSEHPWVFIIALGLGLFSMKLQLDLKREEAEGKVQIEEAYNKFRQYLSVLPDSTILTIPMRSSMRFALEIPEKHCYVAPFLNVDLKYSDDYRELYPEYTGFPSNKLQPLIEKYKIDYIVLQKVSLGTLDKLRNREPYYRFDQLDIDYEDENFIIFKPTQRIHHTEPHTYCNIPEAIDNAYST